MEKPITSERGDYHASEVEKYYEWWNSHGFFKGKSDSKKEKYSIVIPPPNVTGRLHIGHALMVAIEDAIVRQRRMKGMEAVWIPGTDHAGIATQTIVEKELWKKEKQTRHDIGREKFIENVWEWKEKYGGIILSQLKEMGASVDWDREAFTMDDKLSAGVNESFIRLFKRGIIYRSKKLVNWCCKLKTTISNIELDYLTIEKRTRMNIPGCDEKILLGVIFDFAYKIKPISKKYNEEEREGQKEECLEEIIVSTTRPETMLGDVAVAVHPNDERYKHFIGRELIHPFIKDRKMKIIGDSELVDMNFGSGAVKITPGHDFNDYECGMRHKLEVINILNDDGTLNENAGEFNGINRFKARRLIIEKLKKESLYRGEKDNSMNIAICSRSGDIIEPLIKPQWYIDTTDAAKRSIDAVRNGELKIKPECFIDEWNRWLSEPQPWCISRQLWWGHQVPAYYVTVKGKQQQQQQHDEENKEGDEENIEHWFVGNNEEEVLKEASIKFNEKIENLNIRRDEDVLDTWYSSALFPFTVFGWPNIDSDNIDFNKFFPTSLLETGHDILFFWVARMVMMSLLLTDKIPFDTVLLHAVIRDANGEKMSKSKGNVIDPLHIIHGSSLKNLSDSLLDSNLPESELNLALKLQQKTYPNGIPECGTDALRFSLCSYTKQSRKIKFDLSSVVTEHKFCNKIWNAVRYYKQSLEKYYASSPTPSCTPTPPSSSNITPCSSFSYSFSFNNSNSPVCISKYFDGTQSNVEHNPCTIPDLWILHKLSLLVESANKYFDNYQLFKVTEALKVFFIEEFCDVFIEYTKFTLPNNSASSSSSEKDNVNSNPNNTTLYMIFFLLEQFLRLLHPFMPFITEELYQQLLECSPKEFYSSNSHPISIMIAEYPTSSYFKLFNYPESESTISNSLKIANRIRSLKKNFSISQEIPDLFILSSILNTSSKDDTTTITTISSIVKSQCKFIKDIHFFPTSEESAVLSANNQFQFLPSLVDNSFKILLPLNLISTSLQCEFDRCSKKLSTLNSSITHLQKLIENVYSNKSPELLVAKNQSKLKNYQDEALILSDVLLTLQNLL